MTSPNGAVFGLAAPRRYQWFDCDLPDLDEEGDPVVPDDEDEDPPRRYPWFRVKCMVSVNGLEESHIFANQRTMTVAEFREYMGWRIVDWTVALAGPDEATIAVPAPGESLDSARWAAFREATGEAITDAAGLWSVLPRDLAEWLADFVTVCHFPKATIRRLRRLVTAVRTIPRVSDPATTVPASSTVP